MFAITSARYPSVYPSTAPLAYTSFTSLWLVSKLLIRSSIFLMSLKMLYFHRPPLQLQPFEKVGPSSDWCVVFFFSSGMAMYLDFMSCANGEKLSINTLHPRTNLHGNTGPLLRLNLADPFRYPLQKSEDH